MKTWSCAACGANVLCCPKVATFKSFTTAQPIQCGEIINIALEHIEENNKQKNCRGIPEHRISISEANLGQTKDRNTRLKHLLDDLTMSDWIYGPPGSAIWWWIAMPMKFWLPGFAVGAGKKDVNFYTPAEVSEWIADWVNPSRRTPFPTLLWFRFFADKCGSISF